ncbi:MAG: hypothetical protein HY000_07745, partial [Planctomycetes bacterium]|nr:hypothetical protein [Planctomycetota bacterium]
MRSRCILFWTVSALFCAALPAALPAAELAILSEKTWDQFVPRGKEVDAIYGDFVLRNGQIVVVIANPVPGRHANMTVRDVGGSIIDLTVRDRPNDQLSAYYPGRRAYPYRLARIRAEGNTSADAPVAKNADRIEIEAVDGKLPAAVGVLKGDLLRLELVAPATADRPEVRLGYTLHERASHVEVRTELINKSDKPLSILHADDFRADRTFQTAKPGETDLVWFYDKWWGQAYGVVAGKGTRMRLTGSPLEPRTIEFLTDGNPKFELPPGKSREIIRNVFPAADLIAIKAHSYYAG